MRKALQTTPRTTIFAPAKSMPKSIKDAAIILGAPDATSEDVRRSAETLRADGQVRGGGAPLTDVRASAVELVSEVYSRLAQAATSPKEARRLASIRLRNALMEGNSDPGGAPSAAPGSSQQRIR